MRPGFTAHPSEEELAPYFDSLLLAMGLPPEVKNKIRTDTVVSDGITLHLTIFPGPEGAAAVVFVPGTSVYSLVYAECMYTLNRRGFHVIGFDPRGHGQSGGKRGNYTIMELVRDTEAVIDYSLERYSNNVFVVGSSQGGIVAFYVAASESRLRGVVCHNLADLSDPESVRLTRYPTLARLLKPLVSISRIAPNVKIPISFYLDLKREDTKLFGNARNFIDQDPLALKSISLKAMASLANTPLPCPLEKVPTPVMILHGEKDNIFPRDYVQKIYQRLPEPKMFYLAKDRPHLLLIDYVDEIIPPVEQWLREMLSRPPPKR